MPVMFCNFNLFDVESAVIAIEQDGSQATCLFKGNFEEVCNFMAAEYKNNQYEKILLSGPYATAVRERTLTFANTNYNYDDINIEVID